MSSAVGSESLNAATPSSESGTLLLTCTAAALAASALGVQAYRVLEEKARIQERVDKRDELRKQYQLKKQKKLR